MIPSLKSSIVHFLKDKLEKSNIKYVNVINDTNISKYRKKLSFNLKNNSEDIVKITQKKINSFEKVFNFPVDWEKDKYGHNMIGTYIDILTDKIIKDFLIFNENWEFVLTKLEISEINSDLTEKYKLQMEFIYEKYIEIIE